jgi:hypothetical protein
MTCKLLNASIRKVVICENYIWPISIIMDVDPIVIVYRRYNNNDTELRRTQSSYKLVLNHCL